MSTYYDFDAGSRRRRPAVIATAAMVALCAAFLIGYAARGGSHASGARPSAPPSVPPRTATAPPSGTSPTQPPSSPAGTRTTAPGRLRTNDQGVVVGYNHDQAGAIAAAGNYTASLYVHTNRTHARELAVLTGIATSSADATRMAGDFSSEDTALAQLLGASDLQATGVIAYGHPQGYRVETVSTTEATIDVYVAGGQGLAGAPSDSDGAGQTFYEVDQVQLAWQDNDWHLKNWSHLSQDSGPEMATIAAAGYRPFPIGQVTGGGA